MQSLVAVGFVRHLPPHHPIKWCMESMITYTYPRAFVQHSFVNNRDVNKVTILPDLHKFTFIIIIIIIFSSTTITFLLVGIQYFTIFFLPFRVLGLNLPLVYFQYITQN
jgi:hypothetical protein